MLLFYRSIHTGEQTALILFTSEAKEIKLKELNLRLQSFQGS